MKSCTFSVVAAVIVLFFIAIPAFAQTASDEVADERSARKEIEADEEMAEDEMAEDMTGKVMSVNPTAGTMVVRDGDDPSDVALYTTSKRITYTGTTSLSDIRPGDTVTIDYEVFKGSRIANNIVMEDRFEPEEKPASFEKALVDKGPDS